jgi:hypothetical protein
MREGRVTIVDEAAVRDRYAEAVQRIYRLPDEVARWVELGRLVEPVVIDFYQRWYAEPVRPAYTYNVGPVPNVERR